MTNINELRQRIASWSKEEYDRRDLIYKTRPKQLHKRKDRKLPSNTYIKSGSLAAVTTISGYIINDKSNPIIFSIFMNGFEGSSDQYKRLQDQIINALADIK